MPSAFPLFRIVAPRPKAAHLISFCPAASSLPRGISPFSSDIIAAGYPGSPSAEEKLEEFLVPLRDDVDVPLLVVAADKRDSDR